MFLAELDQCSFSRHTCLCFQRTWRIVDARVYDPAVMPCLLRGEFVFFFEYCEFEGRVAHEHFHGRG